VPEMVEFVPHVINGIKNSTSTSSLVVLTSWAICKLLRTEYLSSAELMESRLIQLLISVMPQLLDVQSLGLYLAFLLLEEELVKFAAHYSEFYMNSRSEVLNMAFSRMACCDINTIKDLWIQMYILVQNLPQAIIMRENAELEDFEEPRAHPQSVAQFASAIMQCLDKECLSDEFTSKNIVMRLLQAILDCCNFPMMPEKEVSKFGKMPTKPVLRHSPPPPPPAFDYDSEDEDSEEDDDDEDEEEYEDESSKNIKFEAPSISRQSSSSSSSSGPEGVLKFPSLKNSKGKPKLVREPAAAEL